MIYHFVFEGLADLLVNIDPNKVLAFKISKKSQNRLEELLGKKKTLEGVTNSE